MCVKLSLGDLNSNPCPSHLTNTYKMTITPRICSGERNLYLLHNMCEIQFIKHFNLAFVWYILSTSFFLRQMYKIR